MQNFVKHFAEPCRFTCQKFFFAIKKKRIAMLNPTPQQQKKGTLAKIKSYISEVLMPKPQQYFPERSEESEEEFDLRAIEEEWVD